MFNEHNLFNNLLHGLSLLALLCGDPMLRRRRKRSRRRRRRRRRIGN
jgi:hypothetical protein